MQTTNEMAIPKPPLGLKPKYIHDKIRYFPEKNLLIFHWKEYSNCAKFTRFINQEAVKRKFMI